MKQFMSRCKNLYQGMKFESLLQFPVSGQIDISLVDQGSPTQQGDISAVDLGSPTQPGDIPVVDQEITHTTGRHLSGGLRIIHSTGMTQTYLFPSHQANSTRCSPTHLGVKPKARHRTWI